VAGNRQRSSANPAFAGRTGANANGGNLPGDGNIPGARGGNRGGFNLFGVVRTLGLGAQTIRVLTLGFAALELALLLLSAYGVWKLKHWGLNLAMLVVVFVLIGAVPGLFAGGRLFNFWRFAASLFDVGAAVVTHGEIRIRNAGVEHLEMIRLVFQRLGVHWEVEGGDLLVPSAQSLVIASDLDGAVPEIKTNVWPAFPTDLTSIAITMATQATGSVLFHDWMFSGRMYFTDKLVGMGARIILCDPYRVLIQGPTQLYGEKLESPDIRAGMALLLAALAAKGTSKIRNIRQIERGYERVEEKLRSLGAKISRENE
jgi:hypothetical protein